MTKRTFRTILILSWAFLAATVAAQALTRPYLPVQLQDYLESQRRDFTDSGFSPAFWAALLILTFALFTQVGLFLLKRWARPCYAAGLALNYLFLLLFWRPNVATATAYAFESFNAALSGFLLALIYLSPFKALFEQPQSLSSYTTERLSTHG
jgi:hypothetical protein